MSDEKTVAWIAPDQPESPAFQGVSSTDYDYANDIDSELEKIDPEAPIPVYIVDSGDVQDIIEVGTEQYTLTSEAARIAGAKRRRQRMLIRNLGPNTAWIGTASNVATWTGYPLPMDAELEWKANSEVWGVCAVSETALLGILQEYVVDEDG